MEFQRLLEIVGNDPVFETGLLLAGDVDPDRVRRQLSRWTKAGRILQLRRGVYALAAPFKKTKPHPFLVANRLVRASYVSCQSALGLYGLIPEHVPETISVSTSRPGFWDTPLGRYRYHHIKTDLLFGYRPIQLGGGQTALVATPEKALYDLIYLQPVGDLSGYLRELRLQNLDRLDPDDLSRLAAQFDRPQLRRAAAIISELARAEVQEYEVL